MSDEKVVKNLIHGGKRAESTMVWLLNHNKYKLHAQVEAQKLRFDSNDQESIFHDSLIELQKSIRKGNFFLEAGSILAYWKKIHSRVCLARIPNQKREFPTDPMNLEMSDFSRQVEQLENKQSIEAFNKKHPECSEILAMYINGYSMSQIAKKLGYASPGTARVSKFRCLKKLITFLENE